MQDPFLANSLPPLLPPVCRVSWPWPRPPPLLLKLTKLSLAKIYQSPFPFSYLRQKQLCSLGPQRRPVLAPSSSSYPGLVILSLNVF